MTRRLLPPLAVVVLALAVPASAMAAPAKQRRAERALTQAKRVLDGRGVRTGREASVVLKELVERQRALTRNDRREARALLARPTDNPDFFGDEYAVPEHSPIYCPGVRFCFHWVESGDDAPDPADTGADAGDGIPDYVEQMAAEFENVQSIENGALGWRAPNPDGRGAPGGNVNRVDVYLKNLGPQDLFGYTAAESFGAQSLPAYLVMDDDYAQSEYGDPNPLNPLRVTAAHEYSHVLQNGYDAFMDTWVFESTAVWMEDRVYDSINDYRRYLGLWRQTSDVPITDFDPDGLSGARVYGTGVFDIWLDSRYTAVIGNRIVRGVWERSQAAGSFGTSAYQASITANGGRGFLDEFARFAASSAEWRTPNSGFADLSEPPPYTQDVLRFGALTTGGPRGLIALDNTSYALLGVAPTQAARIKLVGQLPAGTAGALALVGRTGSAQTGAVTSKVLPLPSGGAGAVVLDGPAGFGRVTAALINGDPSHNAQQFSAFISTDFTAPSIVSRSPADGAKKASTGSTVTATFSEPVASLDEDSFQLTDSDGRTTPARVSYDSASNTARLTPLEPLDDTTLYTARLTSGVTDVSLNALPAATWRFRTVRRPPRLKLSVPANQRAATVRRRGVLAKLRSRDADKLKFTIALDGRAVSTSTVVGRKKGSLKSGRKANLRVRLKSSARRRLRRRSLRVTLRVTLRDPQGNTRKLKKRLTVRR